MYSENLGFPENGITPQLISKKRAVSQPRGADGCVVRNKAGFGELRWGGFGIGAGWGWGGGGGLYTQQVAVQCVVRVAAKHWASGLQGTVGGLWGRQRKKMN